MGEEGDDFSYLERVNKEDIPHKYENSYLNALDKAVAGQEGGFNLTGKAKQAYRFGKQYLPYLPYGSYINTGLEVAEFGYSMIYE